MTLQEQRKLRRQKWREQGNIDIEASKQRMSEQIKVPRTHPKFDRAWDIAWELGHSHGIREVEYFFLELSDLLQP